MAFSRTGKSWKKDYQVLESPGNLLNSGNKVFRTTIFK